MLQSVEVLFGCSALTVPGRYRPGVSSVSSWLLCSPDALVQGASSWPTSPVDCHSALDAPHWWGVLALSPGLPSAGAFPFSSSLCSLGRAGVARSIPGCSRVSVRRPPVVGSLPWIFHILDACSCRRRLLLHLVLPRTFSSGATCFIPGCSSPGCRSASPRMIQSKGPRCIDAVACPRLSSLGLLALPFWLPQSLACVMALFPGCSFLCCPFLFVLCQVSLSGMFMRPLSLLASLTSLIPFLALDLVCLGCLFLPPPPPYAAQDALDATRFVPGWSSPAFQSTAPRMFQSSNPSCLPAHSYPDVPVRAPCACLPVSSAPWMFQSRGRWCFVACSWPQMLQSLAPGPLSRTILFLLALPGVAVRAAPSSPSLLTSLTVAFLSSPTFVVPFLALVLVCLD